MLCRPPACRTRQPFLSSPSLRFESPLPKICLLETPMPFSIRPFRRFSVHCFVTYNAGPFQGQGTVWNLSCAGWRLSGDLPMRPGETLSLTVTLPNEQHILIPQAVVRWSRGQEFASASALCETVGARTNGEPSMSDDDPKH